MKEGDVPPAPPGGVRAESGAAREAPRISTEGVLGGVYVARILLAGGAFIGAVVGWEQADPLDNLVVSVVFVFAILITGLGVLRGFEEKGPPGRAFVYIQVIFDTVLVTALVHTTGGAGSIFAALYIPVIAIAALLTPFPGVAVIGVLSAALYMAAAFWGGGPEAISGAVLLQLGLFGLVALLAGIMGDRLRRAGAALGVVQSELRRLRLDTGEVLETVSSGILTVDEGERLVYLNPAGEALLKLEAVQWTGAPVLDRVAAVAPELTELLRTSLESARPLSRELARVERDGGDLTLGVATTVREVPDEPRAVTAIFQDITDSLRLAALDRQNQRLEAVAELAASMAHEIKNPLASIRSAVEQFTSPRISDADRSVLSGMVIRESDRLSRLLSDFIDYSRVHIGRREAVALSRILRDAVAVVKQHPQAEGQRVGIVTRMEVEGEVTIEADPDVLHRAVLNLLLNAVQFSPEGGEVETVVEAPTGEGSEMGVENPVLIRIRDQGPGIPEEDLPRLFDPFFTTRSGGSGLGLSMVHRAMEAHGGAVFAQNREEGGAEFILYLPCRVIPMNANSTVLEMADG